MRDYAAAAALGFVSGALLWLAWQLLDNGFDAIDPIEGARSLLTVAGLMVLLACLALFLRKQMVLRGEREIRHQKQKAMSLAK